MNMFGKIKIGLLLVAAIWGLTACGDEEAVPTNGQNNNTTEYAEKAEESYPVELNGTEQEIYHRFYHEQYNEMYALEVYADVTHDSRDDLIVVGAMLDGRSCPSGYMQIYTLDGDRIYKLYDISLSDAHFDGFNQFDLLKQNGQYYILADYAGVWGGLGACGYEVFWFRDRQIVYEKQAIYETDSSLTGDAMLEEMDHAQEIWGQYSRECAELRKNASPLFADNGAISLKGIIVLENIDRLAKVEFGVENHNFGKKVDIETNWGDCATNAEKRKLTYIVQTKKYNPYYDEAEWKGYEGKAGLGCGICCKAMMLAALGAVNDKTGERYYVKDLAAANGGNVAHDDVGVTTAMAKNNIAQLDDDVYKKINKGEKQVRTEEVQIQMMERLDYYLELYSNDPDKYAPPMINMRFKKKDENGQIVEVNHYVLIVGHEEGNHYVCVDPNLNGRTNFYSATNVQTNNTSYTSPICGIFVLYKK